MSHPDAGTIAAVATGPGGGIGIVRISGRDACSLAGKVFRPRGRLTLEQAPPFQLMLGAVFDPATGEQLDEALAVRMPAGKSYTGEPTVEIQGHGGRFVLEAVLDAVLKAGARPAEPGEFTRRAFLSGRLDLTQAEAVAELVGAESETGRRGALQQLQGSISKEVASLREQLLSLVVRVEAALDLEEDEAIPDLPTAAQIAAVVADIREMIARPRHAGRGDRGIQVVLAGRPNSGKSSIFNYLLMFERSLVSAVPGTTRDYIEERSSLGGASVVLVDTAGLRTTEDHVEAEGVRRSLQKIEAADIVVFVIDGSEPPHPEDRRLLQLLSGRSPIVVVSKSDLPLRVASEELGPGDGSPLFVLSSSTGEGFFEFTKELASRCRSFVDCQGAELVGPGVRHRVALERAANFLDVAAKVAEEGGEATDRLAVDLRDALTALGEITGETVTEEILDRIFSTFCVGK